MLIISKNSFTDKPLQHYIFRLIKCAFSGSVRQYLVTSFFVLLNLATAIMPITLYGFNLSPPYRAVLLAAKAIGVELEKKIVDFQKMEHKTEEFLKMNPTHTVPTLDDNGFHIWESRAIMGYLVQQYGKDDKLYPKEPKKRAVVDNMLYYDAACLYSCLFQFVAPVLFLGKEPNPTTKAMVIERLGFLNTILQKRKFAAGDQLTIADISLIASMSAVEGAQFNLEDFLNIKTWLARVKAELPFYDEVSKKGAEQFENFFVSKLTK